MPIFGAKSRAARGCASKLACGRRIVPAEQAYFTEVYGKFATFSGPTEFYADLRLPADRAGPRSYQHITYEQPRPVWAWLFWLFKLECAGVELVISALLGNQVVVRAAFNDAAMGEHHDRVGVLHR